MHKLKNAFLTKITHVFHIDAHYFVSGGFWTFLGQAVGVAGGIATSGLFAYFLLESDYGSYRYLIGLAAILSTFSLTGISQTVFQAAAKKYREFYNESIRISLFYNIGIAAISVTGTLYYFYNQNLTLAIGCLLIALFQPVINAFSNIPSFLQGSSRFRESTIVQIVKTLVVSIASVISIVITQNILVLFGVYLFSHAITNLLSHLYYRPAHAEATPETTLKKYINYAQHTSVRNFIGDFAFRLDTIFIFQQLGAIELAIYSIANIVPEQIKGSLKNVAALLMPKYASYENIESLKKGIPKRSIQLFLLLSLLTIIYIVVAPHLYQFLFPKYENAIFYSQLAALSFPAFVAIIPMSALQSHLQEKQLYYLSTQSAATTISLTLILILFYGVLGAIIAKIFSRYIGMFLAYYYLFNHRNQNT